MLSLPVIVSDNTIDNISSAVNPVFVVNSLFDVEYNSAVKEAVNSQPDVYGNQTIEILV